MTRRWVWKGKPRKLKGAGRLVRLAMLRRYGVARAAELTGLRPDSLWHWLKGLRKREGDEHLPRWRPRRKR